MSQIASYIAALPDEQRAALTLLDNRLSALLPQAARVISYAMPGLRLGKPIIIGFAAFAKHLGIYPHSGNIIPKFATELDALGFKHSKSGVLFRLPTPFQTIC